MPVESANYIDELDQTYPLVGDNVSKGDDHIRLLKAVLLASFPNVSGAVSASDVELSYVNGVTSAIQTQLNALAADIATNAADITALEATLPAPSGTKMAFYQTAAPSGWTLVTLGNTYALVVDESGNAGTTWGSYDPVAMVGTDVPQHSHSLSGSTSGGQHQHYHGRSNWTNNAVIGSPYYVLGGSGAAPSGTDITGIETAGYHTHSLSGTAVANSGPTSWTPRQAGVRICNKT